MMESRASMLAQAVGAERRNSPGDILPDSGFSFRLNENGYRNDNGLRDKVASFVQSYMQKHKDPAADIKGMPPLFGQDVLPHAMTFQSLIGSYAKTYLPADEALDANPQNAEQMLKNVGIRECLQIRQFMVSLTGWSIQPENSKSPAQKSLAAALTKCLQRIRRFTEYRRCMQTAIWSGKSAIQHRFGYEMVDKQEVKIPKPLHQDDLGWKHIHGDKLVFRYDDGREFEPGAYPDQMGIRVSAAMRGNARRRGLSKLEATNSGTAYFLSPAERSTILCHKHMIEDAEFTNPRKAGRIHGIGIRDMIYNEWFLYQEILGFVLEYAERSAGGIEIWEYPSGDKEAKESIMEAAKNRMSNGRNQLFFPKPLGMDAGVYDLRVVEPGFAGIETMLGMADKYFGHRIKRLILGQTLTTEADATGMGTGVADAHRDTLSQIIRYDVMNHDETLTEELVKVIQLENWPETECWKMKFVSEIESDDVQKKMEGYQSAFEMGLGIPEKDVAQCIGISLDNPNEKLLKKAQEGMGMGGAGNGMQFPSHFQFQSAVDAAKQGVEHAGNLKADSEAAKGQVLEKLTAGKGEEPSTGGDGVTPAPSAPIEQYSRQWTSEDEKLHPRNPAGSSGGSGGQFTSRKAQIDAAFNEANSTSRLPGYVSMQALRGSSAMQGLSREDQDKLIKEFRGKGYSLSQAEGRGSSNEETSHWLQEPLADASLLSRPNAFSGMMRTDNWEPEMAVSVDEDDDRLTDEELEDEDSEELDEPEPDEDELAEQARQQYVASLPTHVNAVPRIQSTHKTPVGEYRVYLKSWQEDGEAQHESIIIKDGQTDSEFWGATPEEALADANEAMGEMLKDAEKAGQVEKSGQDRSFKWSITHDGKGGFGYQVINAKGEAEYSDDGFNSIEDAQYDVDRVLEEAQEAVQLDSSSFPAVKTGKVRLDSKWVDAEMVEQYVPENLDEASAEEIADKIIADHGTEVVNESDMEKLKGKYETLTEKMLDKNRGNEDSMIDGEGWEDWYLQSASNHAEREVRAALIEHVEGLLDEIASQRMNEGDEDEDEDSPEEKMRQIDEFLESVKDRPVKRRQFAEQISRVMDVDLEEAERIVKAKFGTEKYQRRSHRLLNEAASQTDTNPTEAQREAGNYSKGVYSWKGLEIAIENPKGSTRSGFSASGRKWERVMACHYGYFRRTKANDGDALDVYIGGHPDSEFVLVINQIDQASKEFDEFKVVVGCLNRKEAKRLYLANYPAGWKCGPMADMTVGLFKKWVEKGGPMREKSVKVD